MRKLLRSMAKAKAKNMGINRVNKWIHYNWRRVIGAYPVNTITGKRMNKGYHGKQKHKSGPALHLFSYTIKPVKRDKTDG